MLLSLIFTLADHCHLTLDKSYGPFIMEMSKSYSVEQNNVVCENTQNIY